MVSIRTLAFCGVSLLSLTTPAYAQNSSAANDTTGVSGDIIVTARRRDEALQDVPLVVNAVTSQTLDKLNSRDLRDVSSVVPGLSLTTHANGVGSISRARP